MLRQSVVASYAGPQSFRRVARHCGIWGISSDSLLGAQPGSWPLQAAWCLRWQVGAVGPPAGWPGHAGRGCGFPLLPILPTQHPCPSSGLSMDPVPRPQTSEACAVGTVQSQALRRPRSESASEREIERHVSGHFILIKTLKCTAALMEIVNLYRRKMRNRDRRERMAGNASLILHGKLRAVAAKLIFGK